MDGKPILANNGCVLFALSESVNYGRYVAESTRIQLGQVDEYEFPDGENKVCPRTDVSGKDVYVIQSLYRDSHFGTDQKLCRTLFLCSTLKDAGAGQVTAIFPYLAYSRQDKREEPADPLAHRYSAVLMEASGVDRVVTVDVHNLAAFQDSFRCSTVHLEATRLFSEHLETLAKSEEVTVVSPDAGGMRRARRFAQELGKSAGRNIPMAVVDKSRIQQDVIVHRLLGDVRGKVVILYDDMISTGKTIFQAMRACSEAGACYGVAVATHGLFCGEAQKLFRISELKSIVVTDTIERNLLGATTEGGKLVVLKSAPLIAQAIKRLAGTRAFEEPQAA